MHFKFDTSHFSEAEIALSYTLGREERRWQWRAAWKIRPARMGWAAALLLAIPLLLILGVPALMYYASLAAGKTPHFLGWVGLMAGSMASAHLASRLFAKKTAKISCRLREGGIYFGDRLVLSWSRRPQAVAYAGGLLIFPGKGFFMAAESAAVALPPAALRDTDTAALYRFLADKGVALQRIET